MERDGTINLLLTHDIVDDANRLVSLLRNASYKVDPHYVASEQELNKKIQERNWDLAIVQYRGETVPAKAVFQQIRRLNKDIPVILVSEEYSSAAIVEGLRMGAADVVPMDEDQHMLQAVSRALYYLDQRRRLRFWKRRYAESEKRCEELILSSQDGIAIIQEGTYVQVNDAFAQFFDYLDGDGMVLLPVLDSIHKKYQAEFKKYLKPLSDEDTLEEETLEFEGVHPDNTTFPVRAVISQVEYQGDPALQLLVERSYLSQLEAGAVETVETEDAGSSNIRLHDMLEKITQAIRKAARTEETSMLFYLQVDRYESLQRELGIANMEKGMIQVANYLADQAGPERRFGRIREDAYILLENNGDPDVALEFGEQLARGVREQVFDIDDLTFNCTLSIGISAISETTTAAEGCLDRCLKVIRDLRAENKPEDVGNGARLFEAVLEPTALDISGAEIVRMGKQLLDKRLLDIAFQPIVPLHGDYGEYYEVLMRVKPDAFPRDLPEDFIARIFKTEAGKDIDRWVILEAIKALGRKQKANPQTRLFVNISAASICDDQFIPWLKLALKTAGVTPQDLVFQLREIDVSRHMGKAATMVENLHKFHARSALTHFGLAIHPLDIFNRLTVNFVKMDMLLVEKAQKDEEGMENLMTLINELKGEEQCVVVPFVETAATIPVLWQANVDYIQGHYIQAPAPEMSYEFSEES